MDSKIRDYVNALVLSQKGRFLTQVELTLLEGVWQEATYEIIAKTSGEYSVNYLKRDVGPKLWRLLSETLKEKVSKTNFREVIERRMTLEKQEKQDGQFCESLPSKVFSSHQPTSHPHPGSAKQNQDWGEAVNLSEFYGRDEEIWELKRWILQERCRVVSLVGLGGVGKTSLCVKLAQQIQPHFEYVIWRSLQDAPLLEDLLTDIIQFVNGAEVVPSASESLLTQLIHILHRHRCLIVLDSVEAVLQSGGRAGCYHPDYKRYGELIKRIGEEGYRIDEEWHQIGEEAHQSCLVLVGREKTNEVALMEGKKLFVRSLKLNGLKTEDAQNIIKVKGFSVFDDQGAWNQLIAHYSGNPFALKIASTAIYELFNGEVSEFLSQNKFVFDQIDDLISSQIERLSNSERQIITSLAISSNPVSLAELRGATISIETQSKLLGALKSLSDRSLIESTELGYTLQPMIAEYVAENLVEQVTTEIIEGLDPNNREKLALNNFPLTKVQEKDNSQTLTVLTVVRSILDKLILKYGSQDNVREQLNQLLSLIKKQFSFKFEYTIRNITGLLQQLDNQKLPTLRLNHSPPLSSFPDNHLVDVSGLGDVLCVAYSKDNQFLAVGDIEGYIHLWRCLGNANLQPYRILRGHATSVRSIAFHPHEHFLVSGGNDCTIRLWNIHVDQSLQPPYPGKDWVRSVAFSPNGQILATVSDDYLIQLWTVQRDRNLALQLQSLKILENECHIDRVRSMAFSPDGKMLASGSDDETVKLWDVSEPENATCLTSLKEHKNRVRSVVFNPVEPILASSSDDKTVKLWDISNPENANCLASLEGHQDRIRSIAFSPDGKRLASGSDDCTVQFWNMVTRQLEATLGESSKKHIGRIQSIAFSPNGEVLASGNDNQILKLWDTQTYQPLKSFQGHTNAVCSIIFVDNTTLVSGGNDRTIKIWDIEHAECTHSLIGHTSSINSLASNGKILVSGGDDCTIKLWNY
jgi:WD40 repeat protein